MNAHVFVCGYPGHLGGANTELWHTVELWRRYGLEVTLIPTWKADPSWQDRLETIGCHTVESRSDELGRVPRLPGSIVVSMCNTLMLDAAEAFRRLRCRIVWVGCMNWLFPQERMHYRQFGTFERYVFQSRYQRDQLVPQLRKFGYDATQGRIIRGALTLDEFPFRPLAHRPGNVLTIGRISRAAADKFSPQTWEVYGRVPHPVRARVLGFSPEIRRRLGPTPRWAECLSAGAEKPREFLATLHAMVHAGGRATENWPRVGLEAMAAGVPVVADNRGGWREMIRHGQTGYLCDTPDQFAYHTARLAYDEDHRLETAHRARRELARRLAHPETLWAAWQALFDAL